uniref:syntaxin-17-like isoform X2 n=1 Tax=Myxine glutinosa TaxID=7769 RepID=UPI00358E1845
MITREQKHAGHYQRFIASTSRPCCEQVHQGGHSHGPRTTGSAPDEHGEGASRQLQDWKSVNREQINASRTVQQLKHNLRELESLRIRLRAVDQPTFDDRVRPTQDRAAAVVQDFLGLHKAMQRAPGCPKLENSEDTMLKSDKTDVVIDDATEAAPCGAGACIAESADQEAQQVQLQVQQQQIEESWEHLAKDLHELDNLVVEFAQVVYVQQEKMDSITENVERASDNVAEGTQQLGKAMRGAAVVLPVAGAVLGGAVAGPLGLLAGLKVGGLIAAFGGGLLGFTGGHVIQKHRQRRADQELQKLSSSNSSSFSSPT